MFSFFLLRSLFCQRRAGCWGTRLTALAQHTHWHSCTLGSVGRRPLWSQGTSSILWHLDTCQPQGCPGLLPWGFCEDGKVASSPGLSEQRPAHGRDREGTVSEPSKASGLHCIQSCHFRKEETGTPLGRATYLSSPRKRETESRSEPSFLSFRLMLFEPCPHPPGSTTAVCFVVYFVQRFSLWFFSTRAVGELL